MIELLSITKKFKRHLALNQVSFKVDPMEFVGLVGNNGSGKSTIINIISSLIGYNSGQIKIMGSYLSSLSAEYKKDLGIILDQSTLHDDFQVIEFLRIIGKFYDIKSNLLKSRIDDIIELFDIVHDNKTIANLSAGTKMKLQFAASLIHNPDILVYDEPFVNLDIQTIETVKNLLRSFKGKKTLFITSHHLDLVADICERYLIIDEGKIVADIKKDDFENIEQLKSSVKKHLTKSKKDTSIGWLN